MQYTPIFEREAPEVKFRRFLFPFEEGVEYVVSEWEARGKEYSCVVRFSPQREILIYRWNHLRKRWEIDPIPPYLLFPISDWLDRSLSIPRSI